MDVTALAATLVGTQASHAQTAIAARLMKMNAEADAAIALLFDAAAQNAGRLGNVAAGVGTALDVSA